MKASYQFHMFFDRYGLGIYEYFYPPTSSSYACEIQKSCEKVCEMKIKWWVKMWYNHNSILLKCFIFN